MKILMEASSGNREHDLQRRKIKLEYWSKKFQGENKIFRKPWFLKYTLLLHLRIVWNLSEEYKGRSSIYRELLEILVDKKSAQLYSLVYRPLDNNY